MKEIGKEFISLIDKDRAIAKYLWRIIVVLTIVVLALTLSFLSIQDKVRVKVELPAKLIYKYTPVVVFGVDGANKVYYKLWTRYIINELGNFTYEDFGKKANLLKKMMRPSVEVRKDKTINKFTNDIVLNLVKQKFTITKIKLQNIKKSKDLIISADANIAGIAYQSIGKKSIKKSCSYYLKYKFIEGVLYVENFGTDCF